MRIRVLACLIFLLVISGAAYPSDYNNAVQIKVILKTRKAENGQPIRYLKTENPEVTVLDVVLPPGAETGWHSHPVPVYAYVLSGTLVVKMKGGGTHLFKAGDAIIEPMDTPHDGLNTGNTPVHLIAFYTGEAGRPYVIKTPCPNATDRGNAKKGF
ncbi:MAG: cupin domain-containing protein [Nitrospiraceae bacterium]|nr:cupin domain-containing protein [Nitrospiraceae bacterium]